MLRYQNIGNRCKIMSLRGCRFHIWQLYVDGPGWNLGMLMVQVGISIDDNDVNILELS